MKWKNHSRATFVAGRIAVLKNRKVLTCGVTLMLAQAAYATSAGWAGLGADTDWNTAGNWDATPVPGAGDTATFNSGNANATDAVTLSGARQIGSIVVNNTGTTTILGSTPGSQQITYSGGITMNAGAGALTIGTTPNPGTVNNYVGAAGVTFQNDSSSALSLGLVSSVGSSGPHTLTLTGNGTGVSTITTLSGSATGQISVVKSGTGSWTATSASFAGTLSVGGGTLTLGGENGISSALISGGTLQLGAATSIGPVTVTSGTLLLASSTALGTANQTLNVNGGTIAAVTSGRNIGANISIAVGGDFTLGGQGQPVTFAGPVDLGGAVRSITVNNSGGSPGDVFFGVVSNGGITKLGNSTLTLGNSANTYTGLTTVSAGTLGYGANDVIASGDVLINNTGTLAIGTTHTDTVGTVTLNSGGGITGDTGSTLTSTTSFEMQNGTVSAILAGTNIPLNKTTSGAVILSAANTYTGPTTISDGILQLANSAALSTSAVTMNGVRIGLSNGVNIPNAITLGPSIGALGHGLIEAADLAGSSATYSGTINITATPAAGGHLAALKDNTLAVSGVITSTVPVTQRTGLVLYGGGGTGYSALSITGTGGLLNDDGIATSATVNIGVSGAGTLDLTGFNQTLAGLTSGTVNTAVVTNSVAGTKTLTVGNNDVTSTFNGAIQNGAGSVALAKIGNGTTALGGALNVTDSTTVSAGTLALTENSIPATSHVLQNGAGSVALAKIGNGTTALGGALNVTDSTTVSAGTLALTENSIPATSHVLQTGALTITGGQLDIANNKLITTSSRSSTEALVASGRTGGTWSGTGIVTTEDDAIGGSALTTLATATAGDVGFGGTKTFGGQTVNPTDTLVMYTYAGDTNLDGQINGDDYFRIDQGYAGALTGYENGDLNYDGRIDADDYFIIDKNLGNQSLGIFPSAAPLDGLAGVSPVPEPASFTGLLLTGAALVARRRRRRI